MNAGAPVPIYGGRSGAETKGIFAVVSALYLAGLSYASNRFAVPALSFFLAPLPLLAFKPDTFTFLIYYIAVNLLFFDTFSVGANFYFLQTGDACLIAYLTLYLIKRYTSFTLTAPVSGVLVFLYIYIAYVFIRSVNPLFTRGSDHWLWYDLKKYLVLSTAAFFCAQPIFRPRKIIAILLVFIAFSELYGINTIKDFFLSHQRQITWNEIYFSNMFIVSIVLITILRRRSVRIFLGIAVFVFWFSMLATETRSIWLSSTACTILYLMFYFRRIMHTIDYKKILRVAMALCIGFAVIDILMKLTLHTDIMVIVTGRMSKIGNDQLTNPFSSLGYRMFESYNIWLQRTFWGHGTGAYLYMIQTQLANKKFVYWWSIHCEYLEILHKWGFFGLGLYVLFLGVYLFNAARLFFTRKKFAGAMGAVALLTIVNTAIISVSSGYMFRVNMLMWDILMIGIVVYYGKRNRKNTKSRLSADTLVSQGT